MMTDTQNNPLGQTISGLKTFPGFKAESLENLVSETNADVVLSVLKEFKNSLNTSVGQLETAMQTADVETTKRACHKIAGTAELLGFFVLGAECRKIENQLKAGESYDSQVPLIQELVNVQIKKILSLMSF